MREQLIGGRYQIINTLGWGGFGQTYLAEDRHQFNLRCVVKKLQPLSPSTETRSIARQLFEREAQIQDRLGNHPQIPRLLAYFQEQQQFYLVQELIEGHNLSEELPPGKQWGELAVIALLQEILEPLAFVHQQQVIHRDLKPPNLIRRHQDGKIVLIDFGSVKELAATEVLNPQGETQIVTTIGTPGYMPSEQSRGKARFSSDVYAVGMIGIQALTGKRPQELPEDPETAEIIWREQITVSPELALVLDKMVRYDFRERYRSTQSALEAIRQLTPKNKLGLVIEQEKKLKGANRLEPSRFNPDWVEKPLLTLEKKAPTRSNQGRKIPLANQPTAAANPSQNEPLTQIAAALGGLGLLILSPLVIFWNNSQPQVEPEKIKRDSSPLSRSTWCVESIPGEESTQEDWRFRLEQEQQRAPEQFPANCQRNLDQLIVMKALQLGKNNRVLEGIEALCQISPTSASFNQAQFWLSRWSNAADWGEATQSYLNSLSDCPAAPKLPQSSNLFFPKKD